MSWDPACPPRERVPGAPASDGTEADRGAGGWGPRTRAPHALAICWASQEEAPGGEGWKAPCWSRAPRGPSPPTNRPVAASLRLCSAAPRGLVRYLQPTRDEQQTEESVTTERKQLLEYIDMRAKQTGQAPSETHCNLCQPEPGVARACERNVGARGARGGTGRPLSKAEAKGYGGKRGLVLLPYVLSDIQPLRNLTEEPLHLTTTKQQPQKSAGPLCNHSSPRLWYTSLLTSQCSTVRGKPDRNS